MASRGDLVFQAGTHEDVIRLKFQDWFRLVAPLVGWFSEPEHGAHPAAEPDARNAEAMEWTGSAEALAEEARRESGLPGGGKKRVEVVMPSGVYPTSGPFPRGTPRYALQASLYTVSLTNTGARSKADLG